MAETAGYGLKAYVLKAFFRTVEEHYLLEVRA